MNVIETIKGLFSKTQKININIPALIEKKKFPCEGCLILPMGCSELCDKVEMDENKLRDTVMESECCPDCGCKELAAGPCGGMCQNVTCRRCGHRFNFGLPLLVNRI